MKVNIFDCDGVVLDSKEAHWDFYCDFATANGVALKRADFERAIREPGEFFWQNVGIPTRLFKALNKTYTEDFGECEVKMFSGIPEMLERLSSSGVILTMATFNRRVNVERAVGDSLRHFERVFTYEDGRKEACVQKTFDVYGGSPSQYQLIGDTWWDIDTSERMGIGFVGVGWGWMKFPRQTPFPVLKTPKELGDYLIENP